MANGLRVEYDGFKREAVDGGHPLEGWRYAEVRWSSEEIGRVFNGAHNKIVALVENFRAALGNQRKRVGLQPLTLPDLAIPTADEFLACHADGTEHIRRVSEFGLRLDPEAPWLGLWHTNSYRCDKCGHRFVTHPADLEERLAKRGGCPSCGPRQDWRGFVAACERVGLIVKDSERKRQWEEKVEVTCKEHNLVLAVPRHTLRDVTQGATAHPCPECELPPPRPSAHWTDGPARLQTFDELFVQYGWKLVDKEWKGTSNRDGTIQLYMIACLACSHEKAVGLHQVKQKMMQNNSYACEACEDKRRTEKFDGVIAPFGLKRPEGSGPVTNITTPVLTVCPRPNCPNHGRYSIRPDNLHRKGIQCRTCRSTQKGGTS